MKTQLHIVLSAVMLLLIPTLNFAQAPPLGTAADFVLFSSVGAVTNVGTYKYLTHLTGNVGTNSGSSTNFGNVNGVMHDGDGASGQCATDLLFAYNFLGAAITDSTLGPVIGNGTTLKAKTYFMPTATTLNLVLTLNAQGNPNAVFIFKTPTAVAYMFTANPNSKIKLINGAKACNVFWLVSGAVNIGAGATMRGTIVSHGAITMAAQDTLEGRALTVNGAITVSNGALGFLAYTPLGCGSPYLTGPAAPTFVGLASYVVFGTTGSVSDCGTSRVTGNVGGNTVQPTGWNPDSVTGIVHFNDPSTQAAAADLLLIYNNLLGLSYDIQLLDPAEFGHNLVLTPHTYQMNAAVSFTDTLFLDAMGNADAVFIIKIYGAFASTSGSKVRFINGTQAKNVYWFCTGAVSIGANSKFEGAIIAHDAIGVLPGAKLDGRAFSTNGAISTCGMNATIPSTSTIVTQPINQTACVGTSVSLSVITTGTGLTYQWEKGTSNLINGGTISGVNSPTVTIFPVNLSDAATNYNVVISGTVSPSITSNNVSLVVNPLPAAIAGTDRVVCTGSTTTTLGAVPVVGSTYYWTSVPVGFTSTLANPTVTPLVTTTYTVVETTTATGCTNSHSVVVTVSLPVGNPTPITVSAGIEPNCQLTNGTITNTYATTATNSTGFNWSLSNGSAGSIGATTGIMTWANGFSGTVNIQVTANGCNGQSSQVIRTVIITPTVGNSTVITISAGIDPVCQLTSGTITTTYATTATNNTGFNWSLSNGSAGSIGATTGIMTWANGFSGTVNIQVTANGCNGPSLQVTRTVTVIPTVGIPVFTMGPTSTRCQGAVTVIYTATSTNNTGITYILDAASLAVGNSIVASTGAVTYIAGWVGVSLITASATGCYGPSIASHLATTNPRPGPTITGPVSVCPGSTGNVYTTETGMSGYTWTVSVGGILTGGGGTNAITVTWNTVGAQTVSVNYTNAFSCPALAPTVYNITINPLPVPTITGPTAICMGSTGNVYTTQAGMTGYVWNVSAGGAITAGGTATSNTVTITWSTAGAKTVSVSYTNANGCTAATPTVFNISVFTLPVPTITGQSSMCINTGNYTYTTESGMTNYVWNISAGGVINYGSGTYQIQISWVIAGPQTVSVNYSNVSGCNAAIPTVFNVTVNPVPNQAGTITGTAIVCAGTNGVAYTVASIPNANSYVWTLPPNATIASGMGTNSIIVNFAANASSGNITVNGNNLCGNGASSPLYAVTVTSLPDIAGTITGPSSVCQGTSIEVYSVSPVTNASGYLWTIPSGAYIINGINTNTITVEFSLTAVSGNITVLGTNSCGNGTVSPNFAVTVYPIPATPIITNTGYIVSSNAPTGNQWYFEGTLIPGATAQTYDCTLSGTGYYWSIVTLNGCSSAESNHQYVIITGVDSHSSSGINVYPNPNEGVFTLMITSPKEEKYDIRVFNNLGVPIFEKKNLDVTGTTHQIIDLSSAGSGIYTIVIWNSNSSIVKKVVVSK